ncbi:MAG: ligase-associated DNA damage response endonuclease PdeM [Alphaproteobacteria bacterium]|nr:ligase-associated DNA damage response endonuclease PdeM [Alphaproteobacteria bacterium]
MLQLKPDRLGLNDFQQQNVSVCGKSFVADMSGALFWPAEKALIVADLHLEKGSSFAKGGQFLPPYDTRETLSQLAGVIDRFGAETVIALGDSFHDSAAAERMNDKDLNALRTMQEACEWIWVVGNHDPDISERLGGYVVSKISVGGITLRHEPEGAWTTHEIAGHLHPAAKISRDGFKLRRPCFIGNGLRLILPAFGSYTGGLNVLDEAFDPLFGGEGFAIWMLGQEGLYPIATRLLRED